MYLKRVILPIAAILGCVVGFVGYYNWRVTGNPLMFPHLIEQRQYITTAIFLWQHDKRQIAYANPQFDDFYNNFLPNLYQASWSAAEGQLEWKSREFWQFFIGPALSIPFLALPWLLKNPRNRLLLAQAGLCVLGLWIVVYYQAHYVAPVIATFTVLMMLGMRVLHGWQFRGRDIGAVLTRLIVLFSLLIGPTYFAHTVMSESHPLLDWFHQYPSRLLIATGFAIVAVRVGSLYATRLPARRSWLIGWCELLLVVGILLETAIIQRDIYPPNYPFVNHLAEPFREPVERQLAAMPGEHLVLVRYSKDHISGKEYVYNDADIDHAKTVWAREIPGMDLSPLFSYFRNRDVWVFEPDVDDQSVSHYSQQSTVP
jgi:hypothetical protein